MVDDVDGDGDGDMDATFDEASIAPRTVLPAAALAIGGDQVHVAVQVNVVDHDQVNVNVDAGLQIGTAP
jgi:hypothetical protein